MTEDLLHFIWKFKLFKPGGLFSIGKMPLQVLNSGELNTHAGPDFTNGRIRLGSLEWAGNIEIHKRASDWFAHNHHKDKAYDTVILHVVYEYDKEVYNSRNNPIPCFELKNFIEENLLERYEHLYKNKQEIPCGKQLAHVPPPVTELWLERMLIERLESKIRFAEEIFDHAAKNWEETFYLLLCKNFGFKINDEPFLQLGRSLPLHILLKHGHSTEQLEALLFGQAGLFRINTQDTYIMRLQHEYAHLKRKYSLAGPIPHSWKFLRMRPRNFPTIRIAQLAGFMRNYQHTFSKITEATSLQEIKGLFTTSTSAYWENHYVFGEPTGKTLKNLGGSSIENILVNTVCPLLFLYGKKQNEGHHCEKALDWLRELSPEDNTVTRTFEALGYKAQNAGQTQALLQMNTAYCSQKKCLSCEIGTRILKDVN